VKPALWLTYALVLIAGAFLLYWAFIGGPGLRY
jgi:hypothetical protein